MMEEKYLPLGTVCRLKNGEKTLMIIGFTQGDPEQIGKIFDYSGCFYPEGIISSDINFLFNHDQIEEILFKGFINNDELNFKRRLTELVTKGTIDGKKIELDNEINFTNTNEKQTFKSTNIENLSINNDLTNGSFSQPLFNTINFNGQNKNQ